MHGMLIMYFRTNMYKFPYSQWAQQIEDLHVIMLIDTLGASESFVDVVTDIYNDLVIIFTTQALQTSDWTNIHASALPLSNIPSCASRYLIFTERVRSPDTHSYILTHNQYPYPRASTFQRTTFIALNHKNNDFLPHRHVMHTCASIRLPSHTPILDEFVRVACRYEVRWNNLRLRNRFILDSSLSCYQNALEFENERQNAANKLGRL